jgi:ribosome-binding protein aMBF1 (putative translation factor)
VTPADRIRAALATLHWTGRGLAAVLQRDERQVRRWTSGAYEPPVELLAWLEKLAAFHDAHPAPRSPRHGVPEVVNAG